MAPITPAVPIQSPVETTHPQADHRAEGDHQDVKGTE